MIFINFENVFYSRNTECDNNLYQSKLDFVLILI